MNKKPRNYCPVSVGDRVICSMLREQRGSKTAYAGERKMFVGRVCCINNQHRWFDVKYSIGGVKIRECFKFDDFGKAVRFYGK